MTATSKKLPSFGSLPRRLPCDKQALKGNALYEMDWRLKAAIQKTVGALPAPLSRSLYYRIQRHLGSLRNATPWRGLRKGAFFAATARHLGVPLEGQTIVELGTGWRLEVPMALWLCGAEHVMTADVRRLLRAPLVCESLCQIQAQPERLFAILSPYADHTVLARRLRQLGTIPCTLPALLRLTGIRYFAPIDTTALPLSTGSATLHCSTDVLEHVRPHLLRPLLHEANRVLKPGGLTAHRINLEDHFSHTDSSISGVHFLRFTTRQWRFWAGNRFAYHNRLRGFEFERVFGETGLHLHHRESSIDGRALHELRANHVPLAPRFAGWPAEELAISFLNVAGTFQ